MPEAYGGMELDTNTNTLICDVLNLPLFTVPYAVQTGIACCRCCIMEMRPKNKIPHPPHQRGTQVRLLSYGARLRLRCPGSQNAGGPFSDGTLYH